MRILRVVGSRSLPCGCLVGRYETYGGRCVELIDYLDGRCLLPEHQALSPGRSGLLGKWFRQLKQRDHVNG